MLPRLASLIHGSQPEGAASHAGFSKEIDHLLTRVIAIEKRRRNDKKIAA
jgi:hypothetical protein